MPVYRGYVISADEDTLEVIIRDNRRGSVTVSAWDTHQVRQLLNYALSGDELVFDVNRDDIIQGVQVQP